jgi:hypothetical protein
VCLWAGGCVCACVCLVHSHLGEYIEYILYVLPRPHYVKQNWHISNVILHKVLFILGGS